MRSLKAPVQRINLYQERHTRDIDTPLQLSVFAWVSVLGLLLISATYFYLQMQINDRMAELSVFEKQIQGYQAQLAKLKTQLPPSEPDSFLVAETLRLQVTDKEISQAIRRIRQAQEDGKNGFASVFRGLAKHPMDGLWLTDIQVSANGEEFTLRGQALEAILVPKFLQRLGMEPAFEGRTFGRVSFSRVDDRGGDTISFELHRGAEDTGDG